MAIKMNLEELKTLIANSIKEENLHGALPADAVERIKEKILAMRNREKEEQLPEMVSELDVPSFQTGGEEDDRKFPEEEQIAAATQSIEPSADSTIHVDAGSVPVEQMSQPKMGYTPELPEMLKKAEPSELFVFQYNDIGESGENLSFKPMRLMDDPDVKKSMKDLWLEHGKTRADIYVAKFEKVGEIEFNYADGTSKFVEKASLPDYAGGQEYKENPYAAASLPQIDEPTQASLETYIKNSIDLEKVVNDIVMGIVRDSLLTNTEKAVNDTTNVREDIYDTETQENNGYSVAQAVKPMEESVDSGEEEVIFNLTAKELMEGSYDRIELPSKLNESILSGDKALLVCENEQVQQWSFDGKEYFTPVGRISKNKGYIKL